MKLFFLYRKCIITVIVATIAGGCSRALSIGRELHKVAHTSASTGPGAAQQCAWNWKGKYNAGHYFADCCCCCLHSVIHNSNICDSNREIALFINCKKKWRGWRWRWKLEATWSWRYVKWKLNSCNNSKKIIKIIIIMMMIIIMVLLLLWLLTLLCICSKKRKLKPLTQPWQSRIRIMPCMIQSVCVCVCALFIDYACWYTQIGATCVWGRNWSCTRTHSTWSNAIAIGRQDSSTQRNREWYKII